MSNTHELTAALARIRTEEAVVQASGGSNPNIVDGK
jgi:hypothetical protein